MANKGKINCEVMKRISLTKNERNTIWQALYSKRALKYKGTTDKETRKEIETITKIMNKIDSNDYGL